MPKKVVVDASVIVSAVFGGKPRKAFLKALKTCHVYVSPDIKTELISLPDELKERVDESKLRRLRVIISTLFSIAEEVVPSKKINLSRDEKDNAYLALCHKTRTDYLLTGDKDLLEIPVRRLKSAGLNRLKIITPDRFLSETV